MKKRKKVKWINLLLKVFVFSLFIIFLISLYKVIYSIKEENRNLDLLKKTQILGEVKENKEINGDISTYESISFIEVDFSNLKARNKDVSGWLQVMGTRINYPYVKTNDNTYYLNHSFDKSQNSGGWVFLDYRNQEQKLDKNTILYAHGGRESALFGPLMELYDTKDWIRSRKNHYIKIATENFSYVFKVFSLYKIKTTNDYLKIEFSDPFSYKNFLEKIKNRSVYDFKTEVIESDKIITLSTCYNKKEKVVLHGKLIKEKELHF